MLGARELRARDKNLVGMLLKRKFKLADSSRIKLVGMRGFEDASIFLRRS